MSASFDDEDDWSEPSGGGDEEEFDEEGAASGGSSAAAAAAAVRPSEETQEAYFEDAAAEAADGEPGAGVEEEEEDDGGAAAEALLHEQQGQGCDESMLERSKTYSVKKSAKLEYADVMDFDAVHRLYAVWQVSVNRSRSRVRARPTLLRPQSPPGAQSPEAPNAPARSR